MGWPVSVTGLSAKPISFFFLYVIGTRCSWFQEWFKTLNCGLLKVLIRGRMLTPFPHFLNQTNWSQFWPSTKTLLYCHLDLCLIVENSKLLRHLLQLKAIQYTWYTCIQTECLFPEHWCALFCVIFLYSVFYLFNFGRLFPVCRRM